MSFDVVHSHARSTATGLAVAHYRHEFVQSLIRSTRFAGWILRRRTDERKAGVGAVKLRRKSARYVF